MNRLELIQETIRKLYQHADDVARTEKALATAKESLAEAKLALVYAEDAFILKPDTPINGKNERLREAQLRDLTTDELVAVDDAEKEYRMALIDLRTAYAMFNAAQRVASLLSGSSQEDIHNVFDALVQWGDQ